jgi:hypothetical protein
VGVLESHSLGEHHGRYGIWQFFFPVVQVGRLDSSTVCLQVADIVFKEFAGHPKVYIWNGEGRI